jgi:Protein of unknown function (DUF1569)
MKTLANPNDRAKILQRLKAIEPASQRQWGRMTPHQMLCHLSDAFRSCLGERAVRPASRWIPRRPVRWAVLWMPVRWPHGAKGPPEWDPNAQGSAPKEFESDKTELKKLIDRFSSRPLDFQWPEHPILGNMSPVEWLRLGYLHLDHHLRQFGQ